MQFKLFSLSEFLLTTYKEIAMLVLSRRKGENIRIGDNIIVQILDKLGTEVYVGIEAPKHISVHREEIYKKIKAKEKR